MATSLFLRFLMAWVQAADFASDLLILVRVWQVEGQRPLGYLGVASVAASWLFSGAVVMACMWDHRVGCRKGGLLLASMPFNVHLLTATVLLPDDHDVFVSLKQAESCTEALVMGLVTMAQLAQVESVEGVLLPELTSLVLSLVSLAYGLSRAGESWQYFFFSLVDSFCFCGAGGLLLASVLQGDSILLLLICGLATFLPPFCTMIAVAIWRADQSLLCTSASVLAPFWVVSWALWLGLNPPEWVVERMADGSRAQASLWALTQVLRRGALVAAVVPWVMETTLATGVSVGLLLLHCLATSEFYTWVVRTRPYDSWQGVLGWPQRSALSILKVSGILRGGFRLCGRICCCCRGRRQRQELELERRLKMMEERLLDMEEFEGRILEVPGVPCIASFPGKYKYVWDRLVAQGFTSARSISMVFITGDRYGMHRPFPGHPNRACWCGQLWGEQKEWGCDYFSLWIENTMRAVRAGNTLEVFFFRGQVGQGKVCWDRLGAHQLLRDLVLERQRSFIGDQDTFFASLSAEEQSCLVGLGGSQKAEVAWLDKEGIPYIERDIDELVPELSDAPHFIEGLVPHRWKDNEHVLLFVDMGEAILTANRTSTYSRNLIQSRECEGLMKEIVCMVCRELHNEPDISACPAVIPRAIAAFEACTPPLWAQFATVLDSLLATGRTTATSGPTPQPQRLGVALEEVVWHVQEAGPDSMPFALLCDKSGWNRPAALAQPLEDGVTYVCHSKVDPPQSKSWAVFWHLYMEEYLAAAMLSWLVCVATLSPFAFAETLSAATLYVSVALLVSVLLGAVLWPMVAPRTGYFPWKLLPVGNRRFRVGVPGDHRESEREPIPQVLEQHMLSTDHLLVIYSASLVSDLPAMFELATFCRKCEEQRNDSLTIIGLDWHTAVSPWTGMGLLLEGLTRTEEELLFRFSCRSAQCHRLADKAYFLRQIRTSWGSLAEFEKFVITKLPAHILRGKQKFQLQPLANIKAALDMLLGN